ncbi:molybdopterin-dependent oxidoreductase [Simiduia agarivorans]|uniref:Molybdopterin dinucleotide-binding protein n=1 Tax=Simiduia agarivorans (strain DSM 21679 / JCM 13881 / BCRC 17597 / SA1) TaxID=1117647 RepID=K4KNT0_SIMAS|nr:molybdopterin-dependent oxidoreductase [Simiduia agarivorans]AFU99900.1 molybdopterin dinucleotide-binding protein [Simiduia agarivorans SA1 = DSM 21679]
MTDSSTHIHRRACHLCEAICGIEIHTRNDEIVAIKGDKDDPLSQGFICPKAVALQDIHQDPDRLRQPMRRTANGWQPIGWEEAIALAADRLVAVQARHGDDAVAIYAGNPSIHSLGIWMYSSLTTRALNSRNRFSATSVDQLPHHMVGLLMYHHWLRVPVMDLDRTQWVMMLGANPVASNGSVMTAPNMPGRLKALRQRGGKLIVVDPRRTETAELASTYLPIEPGKDIYLLLAMLNHLFSSGQIDLGRFSGRVAGLDILDEQLQPFTPALAEAHTGISADQVRTLADELASTPRAAVYGRMGVSTQAYGTLCQWAIQLLNLLTNHLDVEGGLMLPNPAIDTAGPGTNPQTFNRYQSRVRGLPEFAGEFPAATMAEEMLTPGEGQVRALVTIAGNPVLSTPNGGQLDDALAGLDFMVAVDFYLNETTRHADLILPPVSPLERDNYDLVFHALGVHNMARWSPAVYEKSDGERHDWQIFGALGNAIRERKQQPTKTLVPPAEMVDAMLQFGGKGLSLEALQAQPSGIDLGPHVPRMAALFSAEQPLMLAPEPMLDGLARLPVQPQPAAGLRLIGRRHIRSNNSWMHNYHRLVKGKARDHLLVHPNDLADLGIADDSWVEVRSRTGKVLAQVQASQEMARGVVSLPHGYGHDREGIRLNIASRQLGASVNDLTDDQLLDSISGNAAVNGVLVSLHKVSEAAVDDRKRKAVS